MTAKEHLDAADRLLKEAHAADEAYEMSARLGLALEGIGHALAAIAIELGAPHASGPALETGSGDETSR